MTGERSLSESSSSDEDEEHNAALRSVAIDSSAVLQFAAPSISNSGCKSRLSKLSRKRTSQNYENDDEDGDDRQGAGLKFYQIRVQDLLHKHLDNFFEETEVKIAVESSDGSEGDDPVAEDKIYDDETRLFSNAPLGVTLKRSKDSHQEVRLLPPRYDSSDEDTAEKESRFQAAAVDGSIIKTQAENAAKKARARFLAAEAETHRAVKEEEERVGRLRRERGELWLPSIAKAMKKEIRAETERTKAMTSLGKIGVVVNYGLKSTRY